MRKSLYSIFVLSLLLSSNSFAVTIGASTNTSTLSNDDAIEFTAAGPLIYDDGSSVNSLGVVTTDTNNQGVVSIADSTNELTFTGDVGTDSLKINSIAFDVDGTLSLKGNVYTASGITTDTNNQGTLSFSGTSAQAITSDIGGSSMRFKSLNVSNVDASGITLDGDAFTTSLDFTNNTGTSTFSVSSSKTLSVSGNITQTDGGSNIITGDGKVAIDGTSVQSIAGNFGVSTSSRLNELEVTNSGSSSVTLTGDSYVNTFTANSTASTINISSILNASTSSVDDDLTLGGSGSISLGATTVADGKNLTLNNDATISTLTLGTTSSAGVTINSGKTLTLTGSVTGQSSSTILGASNGVGNLTFSGSSAQNVDANTSIGSSSFRLNTITINNISGVTFNSNTYSNSLSFANTSGNSSLSLGGNYTLTGDISQASGGTSEITGTSGTVTLAGSSQQTVNSSLGTNTTRLGTLIINNSAGAILNQDSYLTDLTVTNGALTVGGDKTIDVTNAINLASKTVNSKIADSSFGVIKSGDAITIDTDTTINFDYSDNTTSIDVTGATKYLILETTGVSGDTISNMNVSDNSFLFDNSLTDDGTNVSTTVSASSNLSTSTLGSENFTLVNSAISHGAVTSGLLSITSSSELDEAIESLKPMQNGAFIQETLSTMDNITNLAFERSHNLNFNETSDNNDKEHYLGFWSKAYGGAKKQSDDGKIKGYTSSTAGFALGFDKRLESFESNNVIGAALGYSNSSIDGNSKTANNDDTVSSVNFALYNSNSYKGGLGVYNENSINVSLNKYKTQRSIKVGTFEDTSKGSFGGTSYMAKTSLGYRTKLHEDLLFSPNISAKYVNISMDDYEETGAGNNSLKVRNEDFDNVITRISFDFAYKYIYENFKLMPKFDIYYEAKLMDAKHQQSIAFKGGGSYMNNNSIDIQKNKFGLDLGVNLYSQKDHYFDLNYNFEGASGFTSHLGALEYRYEF